MGFNPLACVYGKHYIPQRYVLCFMAFMAVVNAYSMRVCLNIALVEMVASVPKNISNSSLSQECTEDPNKPSGGKLKGGQYHWSTQQVGAILAAFFPGYVVTHIPGGFLSDNFGGKHVLGFGVLISAICTILTPLSVVVGDWWLLFISRVIVGISQGPLFPAVTTLLAKWVPKKERSTLGALVLTGPQIGSITGNLISSFLISGFNSWPVVFYFWAIMGFIWYAFYFFMCFSEPHQHPFITETEAQLLEREIGKTPKLKVPWKKLIFDAPCLALMAGQIGHAFAFFLVVTDLPLYMKEVLKFDIKKNGILNSLPYLALWICGGISGVISDILINKGTCSVGFIRKLYTTIASVGPSVCVLLAGYMGCNDIAASAMFILGMFLMGPFYPGMRVNGLDITKNFAGILTAFVNGMGALFFAPVPYFIGWYAKENTLAQWRVVFWAVFIVCTVTNVIYVIWASGERAEWDKDAEIIDEAE